MGDLVGFRINAEFNRPPRKLMEEFRKVSTAALTDAMSRYGAMGSGIRPVVPNAKMVGSALTVRTKAGDNLMCHKANDMAQLGDVLVVDGSGYTRNSIWGELMTQVARKKGVAGVVIDGSVRDVVSIKEIGLPVFSRGVSPMDGDKEGPGEIGFPIQCGGVYVKPGDIVVGDDDGVVVVGSEDAKIVLKKANEIEEKWEKRRKEIEAGINLIPDFVNRKLREKGVI